MVYSIKLKKVHANTSTYNVNILYTYTYSCDSHFVLIMVKAFSSSSVKFNASRLFCYTIFLLFFYFFYPTTPYSLTGPLSCIIGLVFVVQIHCQDLSTSILLSTAGKFNNFFSRNTFMYVLPSVAIFGV